MHLFLAALAVLFIILSFVGFGFGGLPTIVFWILAGACLYGAWKLRANRRRSGPDRTTPP